ncbi:uncharacterized protein JN550_009935 [Neoarthrinium moseri]|uniref:uncharacterized protein n=1 Tax=Neoarthrinium moseri TaxID=1658444 RepID=UPI001FDD7CF0|nr:uncharacterized protein JN550_009935 [Neoarthrinium moseri]KAI1862788.1 hypothetical protein JN550_009935 [Neoarthrinium moseri]
MGAQSDKQFRNLLIRTNIALFQRQIREQSNWYNTPRVVIRKRSGKVFLSRQGNRKKHVQIELLTSDFDSDFEVIDV